MANAEFGIRLPVAGPLANVDSIRTVAQAGEGLGYDTLWVHDFIGWTKYQDRTHVSCGSLDAVEAAGEEYPPVFFESITNLAFLAGITTTVRIGVAVLCLPFRNPIITAKQVACIDVLSGGRLTLGIGVGAAQVTHNVDFEVLGVPRTDKYMRTREYFRVMREIWTKDEPSFEGKFVTMPKTEINPKPIQKPFPPVWVGGGGPKSVEIAALYGTGWLPPWISPEGYPSRIAELKELARQKGRGDVDFKIATEVYVCVGKTDGDALGFAQKTLGVLSEGFADDATPQAIADSGLIGSPKTIREKLEKYVDAGVVHYEMKFVYRDIPHFLEQLKTFATEIAPAFAR